MIDFVHIDGSIKVKGLPLWLDASGYHSRAGPRRRPLNFISHAHADHVGRHRKIICTPATLELIKARSRVGEARVLDFGESLDLAGAKITLYPAGHILGSAQILIEKDGCKICYTGDFHLGGGLTSEKAEPVKCDVLLMECTYGHPRYRFPDRESLLRNIEHFVEACFDDSVTPVLLAYSLGKAQEAVKALELLEYGALAHPAVWKMCKVYERFNISFPMLALLGEGPIGRRVIVSPPQGSSRFKPGTVGPIRKAVLTGWALGDRFGRAFGADTAIPFSDHSDFDELIRTAKESGAGKIYTYHGDAEGFADWLKGEGLDAEPLIPPDQMRLL